MLAPAMTNPPPYVTVEAHEPPPPVNPSEFHPLMAAAHHNKTKSPLCRLPDAVLIRIMRLCDGVSVECLRRSSRTFLRVFPSACRSAADYDMTRLRFFPWPISTVPLRWPLAEQAAFLKLIERDGLCQACLAAKAARDWQSRIAALVDTYLHCSGCIADHAACLFSARERHKPQSERVCIGHEGYMRLCRHVTMPWSTLVAETDKRWRLQSYDYPGRANLAWCEECDHVQDYDGPRKFMGMFPRRPQRQELLHHLVKNTPSYPWLYFCFTESDDCGPSNKFLIQVCRGMSSHISLPVGDDGRFKAEDFTQAVEARYQREGRFICPQTRPGPTLGQQLCDPGRCNCLAYSGKTAASLGWERPPESWAVARATCRSLPSESLLRKRAPGTRCDIPWNRRFTDTCCKHRVTDRKPQRYESWTGVERCENGENCLVLSHFSAVTFELDKHQRLRSMQASWYSALDPESYNVCEDSDGFGVYWCNSAGCSNHHSFAPFRVNRLLRKGSGYWRECPKAGL